MKYAKDTRPKGVSHKAAEVLVEALPWIKNITGKTVVIKYGGSAMVDAQLRADVMNDIVLLKIVGVNPVIVHGGGKAITEAMEFVNLPVEFKDGQRVTTDDAMDLVRMVLTGEVNQQLVEAMNAHGNMGVGVSGTDAGIIVAEQADDGLPDLPNLLRTQSLAEDWAELRRLVVADTLLTRKEELLAVIDSDIAPDSREWRLRLKYPREYDRLRKVLYPQMRAVDFRFNLHRRGMRQDTVYTTEVDSNYMRGMELLKRRNYEAALTILRPYEDRNTALAYLSLGYNEAAYRILRNVPDAHSIADVQYMLAVVASRLGDEEQAVQYFLRAVELRQNLKFRGNLDPEISRLIRKYGLFREDFE